MTQKQYADMTIIMEFGRIFADQMYKCLKNTGLMEQGFRFQLDIGDNKVMEDCVFNADIELTQSPTDMEKQFGKEGMKIYRANRMEQVRKNGERWMVHDDPLCDQGSEPAVVRSTAAKRAEPEGRKETGTDSAPDGLWLSDFCDCPAVDGGM